MSPQDQDDPHGEPADRQLKQAGWSVAFAARFDRPGGVTWTVTARRGEALINAEGPTPARAWADALERSREFRRPATEPPGGPG